MVIKEANVRAILLSPGRTNHENKEQQSGDTAIIFHEMRI
jgi:hypothetical protein